MDPHKPRRKRGVKLSLEGAQKFAQARRRFELEQNFGERYTLDELSFRAGLSVLTVARVLDGCQGVDRRSLEHFFHSFGLCLQEADYVLCPTPFHKSDEDALEVPLRAEVIPRREDWAAAADTSVFYGRGQELARLEGWLLVDECRLVGVLGMGGIGKTTLALKLARLLRHHFQCVVWRTLANAPTPLVIVGELVRALSEEPLGEHPADLDGLIAVLICRLRERRCLMVLDNAETVMGSGETTGSYLPGFEGYGTLWRRLGEVCHRSCLLLTGREKPAEFALLEGDRLPVRSLPLQGLGVAEGRSILQDKGIDAQEQALAVVGRYAGNPLALKMAATTIVELFDGDVAAFLRQPTAVFGDIRSLIDQHFERLSATERDILHALAIEREPLGLQDLGEDIFPVVPPARLLDALESLVRRFLVEKRAGQFSLQPVVLEYVVERTIDTVAREIFANRPQLIKSHALLKPWGKDYLRHARVQLLLAPLGERLVTTLGSAARVDRHLGAMLADLAGSGAGYAAGNLLNLLCHLGIELDGRDLRGLAVWQADLSRASLQGTDFADGDLSRSVFAENFCSLSAVAFSPDRTCLATGGDTGEITLLSVPEGRELATLRGHTGEITALVFTPDGRTLVSSSNDLTIQLWDVQEGRSLTTLRGHTRNLRSIDCSPDGTTIASAGDDGTVWLWDRESGRCRRQLAGHSSGVRAVAFCPKDRLLASAGEDCTVRFWRTDSGEGLRIIEGHTGRVLCAAFSPGGDLLATGSEDRTVRIWQKTTGRCLAVLEGHGGSVFGLAFAPDGRTLASCCEDQAIRLWEAVPGRLLHRLEGHTRQVWSVAFSADGKFLASTSQDQSLRLWDPRRASCLLVLQGCSHRVKSIAFAPNGRTLVSGGENRGLQIQDVESGRIVHTLQGHTQWVQSVAFSPDGRTIASGSDDHTVRLWESETGRARAVLRGHTRWVWSVAFDPVGHTLASASHDGTIRLWRTADGRCVQVIAAHALGVWWLAFSPDGQTLASASADRTVQIWDSRTGERVRTLIGHEDGVWSVAFAPDNRTIASGGEDHTVRLWDTASGECRRILSGHTGWVWSVCCHPREKTIASASADQTVRLWDGTTGKCLRVFEGHTHGVLSVAFSPDGRTFASSSRDEIRLWDTDSGHCLRVLSHRRLYEGMNIAGVSGLTDAQKAALFALGAIEQRSAPARL